MSSGGPPAPPAPPGGSFTSRQPTPQKSPTPPGAPSAASKSPGKQPTPPRSATPTKGVPPPAAKPAGKATSSAAAAPPPPPGSKKSSSPPPPAGPAGSTPPPSGAAPQRASPAPAAGKKSSSPPRGSEARGSSPAPPPPPGSGGKSAATAAAAPPQPAASGAAPGVPGSAQPPAPPGRTGAAKGPQTATPPRGTSPKKVPPSGQPPLAPGAAAAPAPPPASKATGDAAAGGGGEGAVPPVARKSPSAGKKSPARAAGAAPKQPTPKTSEPAPALPAAAPAAPPAASSGGTPSAPQGGGSAPSPKHVDPAAAGSNYTRQGPESTPVARAVSDPAVSPIAVQSPAYTTAPLNQSASLQMDGSSVLAARGSRSMPPRRTAAAAPARTIGVLDHDPRSGLPLIAFPADRQSSLAHLGNDILLHFFEDCDRMSSKGKLLRRIVLVTDQTLFVCEPNGSMLRCVQVSKVSQVNVATDNSNEVALVIPSEYDIILRFDRRSQRDDLLTVLRAVHKRMVNSDLSVWHVKDIKPNQYRMEKPPGFQLQRIPQRSRANLAKALESIDANDRERRMAIQRVQDQLDFEHKQEILDKQQELSVVQAKLDEANARMRTQLEEMEKLRQTYSKIQRRVEEIDSQYSGGSGQELTVNKDMKIRELNEVVDALNASVTKANEDRMRLEKLQRAGDFEEKDLDFVESDIPRLRGRSLHHQGLIEVLQRQLVEKQRELADLQSKQGGLQKLQLDLRKKEDTLRELEQTVTTSSAFKDPSTLYSSAAQSTFDDLLKSSSATMSPSAGRGGGGAASPPGLHTSPTAYGFGSAATLLDDIARQRAAGVVAEGGGPGGSDEVLLRRGALSPPKQLFSTDIPEFRVPPDERDFKEDPRTGLRFKDLEGPFVDKFPSLQGAIMFFFAVGTKENKRGQSQKRVLIVTDQVVYQCTTGGAINRTFEIKDVRQFIRDRDNQVALIVEGLNEYDLLMRFKDSPDTCLELLDVIQKTSAYNKRVPPLVVKEVERISPSELRLEKPPTWEYVDRRARPRRGLYRALQQLGKTSASERLRANTQQEELRRDLTNRIREELLPEVAVRREREYVRLRQQLITTQQLLQEKQLEVRNHLRQIQTHKCSVAGVAIQQSTSVELFDTQGMYWIPSDPVVMEAQHEILHIQFSSNFIVTSHPNGFLNVWDVTSADLLRTLKINGHVARVTTFWFEGYQVLSGGHDSSLRLWHIMQPTPQFVVNNAHRGAVTGVQFSPSLAVSSGADGVLQVWDFTPTSLKHSRSLRAHKSAIVGFKMENSFLASAEWGWIFLWDVAKGVVIRTLRDDVGGIMCIDISGNRIITGGAAGAVNVWSTTTGEAEALPGHADDVHSVMLQGAFAVSSSGDGTVRMWDTRNSGSELGVFHECFPQEVKSFYFRANRFVVGEGTTIKCWTR